ncbi:MAG TPA: c-type cytochrome [Gammaproteobacteria bacterium]|nr:c-type cytochrome [Gammaproteobacteria bacterium]
MNKTLAIVVACAAMAAWSAAFARPEGNAQAGKQKAQQCAACHGQDGNSTSDQFPKLAGQNASYIYAQLRAFKSHKRTNAIMNGMAAGLSKQDMANLAAYFSSQTTTIGKTNPDLAGLGKSVYKGGDTKTGVPACSSCHGPKGLGNGPAGYPRLSGQHAAYVVKQLKAFASGQRSGTANAKIMDTIASKLTAKQIKAVASYVQGLH